MIKMPRGGACEGDSVAEDGMMAISRRVHGPARADTNIGLEHFSLSYLTPYELLSFAIAKSVHKSLTS